MRAALCSIFGGSMDARWYVAIADTADQATYLRDLDENRAKSHG